VTGEGDASEYPDARRARDGRELAKLNVKDSEGPMRKIIESTLVSIDGVFGDPHVWATSYFDQEAERYALELLSAADAMLMGRRTYEFFAAAFPHQMGEYGARINAIRKYVFSNTLRTADWNNSSITKGDVVAEAIRLKQQEGKDLVLYGHGLLGRTLLKRGLIDELKLWIHPLFVGRGEHLFREGEEAKLDLLRTKILGTGVVVATYGTAPA
jgi:dihydrofolate reductase